MPKTGRALLSDIITIAAGVGAVALAAAAARNKRAPEVRVRASSLDEVLRKRKPRREPPEAGVPMPANPPSGPQPKQGGAAAPLDFGS